MTTSSNNLVAKHAHKYNRAATHQDRKQAHKKGYVKHQKAKYYLNALLNSVFK